MTFKHLAGFVFHRIFPVLLVISVQQAVAASPDGEKRIALVIGIAAYQNAPHLANPVNDARAIGESLRRLKFDVVEIYDASYRSLSTGIREFGIRAATADVAVVYYAGHGVQVDRENYLIPGDAKLERERDLLYEAMPLDRLLGEVSQASKIGIVLLDSCRNNPFIERVARSMSIAGRAVATTPGLARVDNVPRNTMVVMAAKADQIAEDGYQHSPFAAALLAHFQIPGLELSLFFRSVRDTVLKATSNRQEPYVFSSLGADPFYFYPRPPNRQPEIATIQRLELVDISGPTPIGMPQPTDPDQDPLTVRVIGLPRSGEVRVEGRLVQTNTVFAAEKFQSATYKPDGKVLGPVGTIDILVEDGRGGSLTASLPITVLSSRHPPVVDAPRVVRVLPASLGISSPSSPDGDPLSVTVKALPRGVMYNGSAIVRTGDRLKPQDLPNLTFQPDPGIAGSAGTLRYIVDNGRGDTAEGSLDVEVAPAVNVADLVSQAALWEDLRTKGGKAEIEAFLQLFPMSRFAEEARRLRGGEAVASAAPAPPPVPRPTMAPPPPSAPAVRPVAAEPQKTPEKPQPTPQPTLEAAVIAAAPPVSAARVMAPNVPVPPVPQALRSDSSDDRRFRDCSTCPWMIRIPSGSFMMGQGAREAEATPAHRVDIRAFALSETPITVAEWKRCMAAAGCGSLPRMRVAEERTPVHNVSWDDAAQYTSWLSRTTNQPYRLPSEAEWEYGARAGTATRYWWGEAAGIALANCADCGGRQDTAGPLPVDALQPNPFGLYGMLGGVSQWVADCWFANYHGAPTDGSARDAKSCLKRVLRGGSFRETHDRITIVSRGNYDSGVRYIVNGFRIARNLE